MVPTPWLGYTTLSPIWKVIRGPPQTTATECCFGTGVTTLNTTFVGALCQGGVFKKSSLFNLDWPILQRYSQNLKKKRAIGTPEVGCRTGAVHPIQVYCGMSFCSPSKSRRPRQPRFRLRPVNRAPPEAGAANYADHSKYAGWWLSLIHISEPTSPY